MFLLGVFANMAVHLLCLLPRIGRYAKISAESREAYRACSLALLLVVQLQCPVQHLVCPLVVVWPELRLHSVSNAGQGLLETAVQLSRFLLLCLLLLGEYDRSRLLWLLLPYLLKVLRDNILMPFLFFSSRIDLVEPGYLRLRELVFQELFLNIRR